MRVNNRVKSFIKKNKILIIFFTLPVLIICMFLTDGFLPLGIQLKRNDWLVFWGSVLAYIGTVFLGWLALKQNKKIQKTNDEWQKKFFETNQKTLELNQRLTRIEEQKHTPFIIIDDEKEFNIYLYPETNERFKCINDDHVLLYKGSYNTDDKGTIPQEIFSIELDIKNISETNIKDIIIKHIFIQIGGASFQVNYSRDCKHNSLLINKQKKILYTFQRYSDGNPDINEDQLKNLDGCCLPTVNIGVTFELKDFANQPFEEKIQLSGPSIKKSSRYDDMYYTYINQRIESIEKQTKY